MSDPPSTPTRSETQEIALLRSAAYHALALGFGQPSPDTIERLASAKGARHVGALMVELTEYVLAGWAPTTRDELERRHVELFSHAVRGRVPLYETEYGKLETLQQPRAIADICGFVEAFGLHVARGERPDHLRVECELMAFLARKEAFALQCGDHDMLAETRKATRLFLRDHLGCFAPALGARLEREDAGGFFGALGGALHALVTWDCARVDVEAGPEVTAIRLPVIDDDIPMVCGGTP